MTIKELKNNFLESFEECYTEELMVDVPAPHESFPKNKPITVSCGTESQLLTAIILAVREYLDEEELEDCDESEDSRAIWLEALQAYLEDNICQFQQMKVNPRVNCQQPTIGTLMMDDIYSLCGEDGLLGFREVLTSKGRFSFFGVVAWEEDTDYDPVFLALYLNLDTKELDIYEPMQGNLFPCALEEAYAATERMAPAAVQAELQKYPWVNLSAYGPEDYPVVLAWMRLADKVRGYQSWCESAFRSAVNNADFSFAENSLEETVCKQDSTADTDGIIYFGFNAMEKEMTNNVTLC